MKIKALITALSKWDKISKQTFVLDLEVGEILSDEVLNLLKPYWNLNLTLEIQYGSFKRFTFRGNIGDTFSSVYNVHNPYQRLIALFNYILPFVHQKSIAGHESKLTFPETKDAFDSLTNQQAHDHVINLIVLGEAEKLDEFISKHYEKLIIEKNEFESYFFVKLYIYRHFGEIAEALQFSTDDQRYALVKQVLDKWDYIYTQSKEKLQSQSQLMMECMDTQVFPREVIWSQDLTLHYSAKLVSDGSGRLKPKRLSCVIPDPTDPESELTLHEKMFLTEALFVRLRNGKPLSGFEAYLSHKEAKKKVEDSKKIECVEQIEYYPGARDLENTTYLVANIGFIFAKKYQHMADSFGMFVTFPIEDPELVLITQSHVHSIGEKPHAEVNFYAYLKTERFMKWLVAKLTQYQQEHKDEHPESITCYGIVIDKHASNTICDTEKCQQLALNEQSPFITGNTYSVVKKCLTDAKYEIPKHGYLRMVTRTSSVQGDNWASDRDHGSFNAFEYQEFNKDMRQTITPELKRTSVDHIKSRLESKEAKENPYLRHRLRGNGVLVVQPTMSLPGVLQKIKSTCKVITLTHTTFFRNRNYMDRSLKTEFQLPKQIAVNSPNVASRELETEQKLHSVAETLSPA